MRWQHPALQLKIKHMRYTRILLKVTLLFWLLPLLTSCAQLQDPGLQDQFQGLQMKEYSLPARAQATFYYLQFLEMQKKDPDQALSMLEKALQADPHPELYLELAQFHWNRQSIDQAEETLLQARKNFPDNEQFPLALSRLYNNQRRPDKARKTLELYLMHNPGHPLVSHSLAELQLEQDRPGKALDTLHSIPEAARKPESHLLIARAYLDQEDRQAGIRHLRLAIELDPGYVRVWAELAYQYELARDYIQARQSYQKLLELGMDNQEIYSRLIDINLKLNLPEQAMQLVEKGPEHERFLLQASNLFLQHEFYSQARELLNMMQSKGYSSPRQDLLLAVLAFKGEQDPQLALQKLQQIPHASEFFERGLDLQARLLYNQSHTEQALEKTSQGRKMFPENQSFWLLESEILLKQNRIKQARDLTSRALDNFPGDKEVMFQMGFIKYKLELESEALELMEEVIEQDPEYAPALNFVGYSLAERGRNLQRALILIKKALQLDPDNGYYLDSLAWVYYQSGNLQQAWKYIRAAAEQVQDDHIIWEHYADIAAALNKTQEAQKAYQRSLDLDAVNEEEIQKKLDSL